MKETLRTQMKEAMKAKDKVRLDTIRGLLSEIQYEEMQKSIDSLDEAGVTQVLQREKKKRAEEIDFAKQANRAEAIVTLQRELEVIESFLPKQLSEGELEKIIAELKSQDPALSVGSCMGHLKEKFAGQYDGKMASNIVRRVLGG